MMLSVMIAATPVVSLLGGLLVTLGLSLCGLGVYTHRERSTPGSTWFARLLGALGGGTLAAAAVGFATGFDAMAWLGVLYAVVLLTPIPWIGFVAAFTGRGGLLGSRRLALLSVPLFAGVVVTFAPTFIDSVGPAFLVGTLTVFFYGVMLVFVGAALLIRTTYLYAHLSVVQGVAPALALVEPWFFLTFCFSPSICRPSSAWESDSPGWLSPPDCSPRAFCGWGCSTPPPRQETSARRR